MNRIHIGTSGWHYDHWTGRFYPEELKASEHFAYYQRFFKTVELNSPFYHLPSKETFANWRKATAKDFLFIVKASRYITHNKKLKDPKESLKLLFSHASALKEKLGPFLFQLPSSWKVNHERFEEFLKALSKKYRYVFEFRNPTWYDEDIYALLRKYNCAFCIYELAHHLSPVEVTADFVYVRLHGPGGKYQGNYSEKALREWAEQCREWKKVKKEVFVYFDNDQRAYAAFNALRLLELVK